MLVCRLLFQNYSFKKSFQEHYQSVKQFESRSGPELGAICLQGISVDDKCAASGLRFFLGGRGGGGNKRISKICGLILEKYSKSMILTSRTLTQADLISLGAHAFIICWKRKLSFFSGINRPLVMSAHPKNEFSYFSTKTYVKTDG